MSKRSLRMELAVSVPPAPFPIIVCVPECSDVNAIAFNVPFTPNGSSFGISFGLTTSSLSQDAINFKTELFFSAFLYHLASEYFYIVYNFSDCFVIEYCFP